MSIEAIQPVSSQSMQAAQSTGASDVSVRPDLPSEPQAPGMTENIASHVYDTIDIVGTELPPVKDTPTSKVNKLKEAMSPENKSISANPTVAKPEGNEALQALSKSFDHAVFMAMVNQVISGVGDTSRTLIRQT